MPESSQLVICVAGMHRSGTSMIARLLNLCGLDLGDEKDMMPASPANPEGYWEHIWFNYYNNQILEFFRGAWDMVPVYHENWQNTPGIHWIRREAGELVKRFTSPVWGWKDPRNSITLQFWKMLIPQMKTLVCLRNPLDVANSLNKRGSSSILFGLQLWWQYNSMLLLNTEPHERTVTHFDTYFRDGRRELNRLVGALGMTASESAIEEAVKTSKDSLRHSVTTIDTLAKATPWEGLMETYCRLLVEAGDQCQEMHAEEWERVQELAARWTPLSCCLPTAATGHGLHSEVARLRRELEMQAAKWQEQVNMLREEIAELNADNHRLVAAMDQITAQRDEAMAHMQHLANENAAIKNSKTWRLITRAGSFGIKAGLVRNVAKTQA